MRAIAVPFLVFNGYLFRIKIYLGLSFIGNYYNVSAAFLGESF